MVVITEGCPWHQVGRDEGGCSGLYSAQDGPPQRGAPKSRAAVEKTRSRIRLGAQVLRKSLLSKWMRGSAKPAGINFLPKSMFHESFKVLR